MLKNSLVLLLLCSPVYAELPLVIKDTAVRKNFDYLDGKLIKAQKSIDEIFGTTFSTGVGTVPVAHGGTGATTAAGARTNLSVPSTTGSGASGTWNINILGNAATVTDGVYTTGSYSDPSWITSLSTSKIDLSTVTANHVLKSGDTMSGQLTIGSSLTLRGPYLSTNTINVGGPIYIDSSADGVLYVRNGTTGLTDTDGIKLYNSGNTAFLTNLENDYFRLGTNGANIITMRSGGNVGIGNLIPNYPLDVNGTVSATAYLGDGSNLTGFTTAQIPYISSVAYANSANAFTSTNTFNYGLRIGAGAYYTNIIGGAQTDYIGYTLPYSTDSVTGRFLQIDGSGNLSWQEPSIAGAQTFYFGLENSDIANYYAMYSSYPFVQASTATATITAADVSVGTWTTLSGFPQGELIPEGIWDIHIHANVTTTTGRRPARLYGDFYKRDSGGTLTFIARTEKTAYLTSGIVAYAIHFSTTEIPLTTGDRIIVNGRVETTGAGTDPEVNVYFGGVYYSHVEFPGSAASIANFVPYSGATNNINIGAYSLTATNVYASNLISSTATLASNVGAWNAFASTGQAIIGANQAFVSTASSKIGAWEAFQSTFPAGVIPSTVSWLGDNSYYPMKTYYSIYADNTANTDIHDDDAHAGTLYPLWVTATSGYTKPHISSSKLTFVNNTGTLSATAFSGNGSALTGLTLTGIAYSTDTLKYNALAATNTWTGQNSYNNQITVSSNVSAIAYEISGSTVISISNTDTLKIGVYAGALNSTGHNLFVGYKAGQKNTNGYENTFIGYEAGAQNIVGSYNSLLGGYSLYNNIGSYNVSIGNNAGYFNTTGEHNVYIGYNSGMRNTIGSDNVIIGDSAANNTLTNNNISSNTIIGSQAGHEFTTAKDNTLIGWHAGYAVTTGTGNIVIGYNQDTSAATASSELNIGGIINGNMAEAEKNVTIKGTATVTGNAFSVGGSTFIISNGVAGMGLFTPSTNTLLSISYSTNTDPTPINRSRMNMHLLNQVNVSPTILLEAVGAAGAIESRRLTGAFDNKQAITANSAIFNLYGGGYNGSNYANFKIAMRLYASENWTTTANGTYFGFDTTPNGSTTRAERMRIDNAGNVGIGTTAPLVKLDVNDSAFRVEVSSTITSATDPCDVGTIRWDASYIYVCTATNTWKRAGLATWP